MPTNVTSTWFTFTGKHQNIVQIHNDDHHRWDETVEFLFSIIIIPYYISMWRVSSTKWCWINEKKIDSRTFGSHTRTHIAHTHRTMGRVREGQRITGTSHSHTHTHTINWININIFRNLNIFHLFCEYFRCSCECMSMGRAHIAHSHSKLNRYINDYERRKK